MPHRTEAKAHITYSNTTHAHMADVRNKTVMWSAIAINNEIPTVRLNVLSGTFVLRLIELAWVLDGA